MVKYDIVNSKKHSKLHAVVDCLFFSFLALIVSQGQRKSEELMALSSVSEVTDIVTTTVHEIYSRWKFPTREGRKFKLS